MNLTRILLLTLIFAMSGFTACSQTFQTLFSFANTNGAIPTGLTLGKDGNFYGLADSGGNTNLNFGYGYGTVFRLTPNGQLTTLVYFNNTNGASSLAAPTLGKDGNFYGTTFQGGDLSLNFTYGDGSIFRLTPNGNLTTLVKFNQSTIGANPAGLTPGNDGTFYGTTQIGGSNGDGTIFRVTTNGTLTTLVNFSHNITGADPIGLTLGRDGNFYGTISQGGGSNSGTVFQMTPGGTLTTLVTFSGTTDGAYPLAPLALGNDGNFYGTTHQGGDLKLNNKRGFGTIFKITTSGQLTTLVNFNGTNGASPTTLTLGNDGNFYGLTDSGGNTNLNYGYGYGTVYRLTPNGQLTTLVYFNNTNGATPSGLALGKDGNFYGTTRAGGRGNFGTVFRLLVQAPDVARPTVSIVSPTFNQQWSNATFTVTGKAADNVAVSTVLYSLNSGPWLNATTANGWTNWTGSLTLTPGTNTVQAYAVDTSGNHSTTNTVSFEYVVLMPVTLQIYGQGLPNPNSGSLSPNYTNGTRLVLNQNYSLTAMPAAGFAFTNWSDGSGKMLTNGPTLRFTMAPSLSLRANFKDGIAPTLSIVSPTFNQQWSNATFTVTGKAADNVAVSTVLYSLNSGPWLNATTANGWTNWTGSLNLTPGTNTVQAYAVDTSGNHSTTNSVSFEYVVLMPVTLQIYGQGLPNPKSGSLSPNYTNGTRLVINESYSVTAMPAANFAFANWTDGSGKMITSGPTLRFTMAPSLSLRANFKDGIAPTVSIVSPKFNQQWSNATFTVTGKAGDNIAVGNVLYSLNSGPWLNATTANGWTNWTGSLTLTPGTNTVQAYAVDSSGNHSTTNTVSFEYVVLMPVAVQVYGLGVPNPKSGSLSPNYTNGTRLAINEDYSITATPAAGFAFTNWTDGSGKVLTNGHILRFIMAPSLSLRANFRDGAAPTVSIVSPKFNQQWSNATFTVTGKAGDNIAVGNVLYSLNSGPWTNATTANSWTNWTGSLNLTPGTNTVQAYAVDSSGNRSTTNTIRFEYVVLMPVTAQVYGLGVLNPKWGSLSPNFSSGKSLPVNEKSKVTARASHGFAFTNWTDGSGKVLTNGHTLQFIMTTNLALHANFVDTTRPTLSIVTPKTRQKLTNGIIVADGRATDNAAVQAVYYSLNGSAWSAAVLATNSSQWSATLILTPGTNTVLAYALDTSGNASTTHSVTFEYQTAAQPQIVAQASAALAEEQTAPAILEALAAPANGQFALSITGTAGQTYVLQVSTDLLNWSSVATNQSPFTFVDTDAAKYPQRFYRSISLP